MTRGVRIGWMGVFLLLVGGLWGKASELGDAVAQVFQANAWTRLSVYLSPEGRTYVRIPNLRSGFLTADQAQALFQEMERRLETRAFQVVQDEGSERNRWLVRGAWHFHDRAHGKDFEYTVELGWEFRDRAWRLIVLQTR
ncbi:MAG: hypothetical protein NZ742_08765 [Acidobacteria bacterium]|nr:hypothetical protein [Acidobacteriota bacterium]MDW7983891.1 hypothetical protein [Acidobacteriota bacterium]